MTDIRDPRLLWAKFALFVVLGLLGAAIALVLFPSWRLAVLMAVTVWAFCRAYYFAFYVVEHYIDGDFRFAGLGSLVRYALRQRGRR
ncbi:MAG: hypothetical protein CMJ58_11175 [Planctomycetaceae bacterium]|nr:hypothetical protein [Planctomycetaceae bacterium]